MTQFLQKNKGRRGFTLVEVLVAAVIFCGVFLVVFSLLGKALSWSSGGDLLRAASIAEVRLAEFYAGAIPPTEESTALDGVRFLVESEVDSLSDRLNLKLTVVRLTTGDTLGEFYALRWKR